jgi:hypothetical protein
LVRKHIARPYSARKVAIGPMEAVLKRTISND